MISDPDVIETTTLPEETAEAVTSETGAVEADSSETLPVEGEGEASSEVDEDAGLPVDVVCELRLWGAEPRDLVEYGQSLVQGTLSGKVCYLEPPTGWVDGCWSLRFTTSTVDAIQAALDEVPVQWTLYVEGTAVAGTVDLTTAEVTKIETMTQEAEVSVSKRRRRNS